MSHRPSLLTLHPNSPLPALNFNFSTQENNRNYFYLRENNAYTEDDVLIYNIFVYNIPKQIAEDDVHQYFSKFGPVVEVKLVECKNKTRRAAPKVGFVSFAEPESACGVLRNKEHRLQDAYIGVLAGESWNQPNADKVCGPSKNEDDVASTSKGLSKGATVTNGGMHMLSLNDDCIEKIFGYLELKDQVRFARVCDRFQGIFQMHYKRQFKNFVLHKLFELTLWEKRDVFRFAGGNMASITGIVPNKNRERIIEFIRIFCRKLKRIRLDKSQMRNRCLKKLLRSCPQLQKLTLRKCSLNDNCIETMTHLSRLKTLDLAGNEELTGKFISKLAQLKVLTLYGCCKVQTSHLINICKSLPNLKSLDIRECLKLKAALFDVIDEHCKELEILKMSCCEFPYERVALLPRLKQLELLCFSSDNEPAKLELLAELVAHKADQLEILKITALYGISVEHIALISELRQVKTLLIHNNASVNDDALIKLCKLQQLEDLTIRGSSNLTNQGLLVLLKSCQRLHHLDIRFCKQITIDFLLETIRFLKASGKHKKPLVLKAYGTSIGYYDAIKYDEYKDAEKHTLIRVIFNAPWLDLGLEEGAGLYELWHGERMCDREDDTSEDEDDDVYLPEREIGDDVNEFDYEIFQQLFPDYDDVDDYRINLF